MNAEAEGRPDTSANRPDGRSAPNPERHWPRAVKTHTLLAPHRAAQSYFIQYTTYTRGLHIRSLQRIVKLRLPCQVRWTAIHAGLDRSKPAFGWTHREGREQEMDLQVRVARKTGLQRKGSANVLYRAGSEVHNINKSWRVWPKN